MRKLIEYKEKQLNVLVSQIELTYNKTIIYHLCHICENPILITDFRDFGEQCANCKKWFCTNKQIGHKYYFDSCSFKTLFGCFNDNDNESDEAVELLCLDCITKQINDNKGKIVCEHISKSIELGVSKCATIIINNDHYYCEECDAHNKMIIYL